MSERNYKPKDGPLGKYRRTVETPMFLPEVNTKAVMALDEWRDTKYGKPILDGIIAHYRFEPVNEASARAYTNPWTRSPLRAVGKEAVKKLIDANKPELVAAEQRQAFHIAEDTDKVLGVFWKVATVRRAVLNDALDRIHNVSDDKPVSIPEDVAAYAADTIIDMGLCFEKPVEPEWDPSRNHARSRRPLYSLKDKINQFAPNLGTQVVSFGAYAIDHPESLASYDGVTLMDTALGEQEYRIDAWNARRVILAKTFPGVTQDISYLDAMTLPEMLSVQDELVSKPRSVE